MVFVRKWGGEGEEEKWEENALEAIIIASNGKLRNDHEKKKHYGKKNMPIIIMILTIMMRKNRKLEIWKNGMRMEK